MFAQKRDGLVMGALRLGDVQRCLFIGDRKAKIGGCFEFEPKVPYNDSRPGKYTGAAGELAT